MKLLEKQQITVLEFLPDGTAFSVVAANLQFTIDLPAVAMVSTDAAGNDFVVAVGPGLATLTVTDKAFNLTQTASITVEATPPPPPPLAPNAMTVTLGTPVSA